MIVEHTQFTNPTKYNIVIVDALSSLIDIWTESKKAADAMVDLFTSDGFGYTDISSK